MLFMKVGYEVATITILQLVNKIFFFYAILNNCLSFVLNKFFFNDNIDG